jgi:transcriptional regulator with XRE-family HTH domain
MGLLMARKFPILERLRAERERQGIDRMELSQALGYDYSAISGWERSERTPSFRALMDWCDALGVKLDIWTETTESGSP